MSEQIKRIVVLGANSTGLLAALTLKSKLPHLAVAVIPAGNESDSPAIRSGALPVTRFLHSSLRIDQLEFHEQVRPVPQLGLRLNWTSQHRHVDLADDIDIFARVEGLTRPYAFYCQERIQTPFSELMAQGKMPVAKQPDGTYAVSGEFGYQLEEHRLVTYLAKQLKRRDIELAESPLARVQSSINNEIDALVDERERVITGDLFLDCSEAGLLALERQTSRSAAGNCQLPVDRVLTAKWQLDGSVPSYQRLISTASGWLTINHSWEQGHACFYYASDFTSEENAAQELTQILGDCSLAGSTVCRPGFRRQCWDGNVVAIGGSAGTLTGLGYSDLHVALEQIRLLADTLYMTHCQPGKIAIATENARFVAMWDSIQDYAGLLMKFNTSDDSEFWDTCRSGVKLRSAADSVAYYQENGPCPSSTFSIYPYGVVAQGKFIATLLGLGITYENGYEANEHELSLLEQRAALLKEHADACLQPLPLTDLP